VGIENFAPRPRIPVLLETPQDRHTDDGLVLALVLAFLAQMRWIVARLIEQFLHGALEFPILFGDADDGALLLGFVIDSAPNSDR